MSNLPVHFEELEAVLGDDVHPVLPNLHRVVALEDRELVLQVETRQHLFEVLPGVGHLHFLEQDAQKREQFALEDRVDFLGVDALDFPVLEVVLGQIALKKRVEVLFVLPDVLVHLSLELSELGNVFGNTFWVLEVGLLALVGERPEDIDGLLAVQVEEDFPDHSFGEVDKLVFVLRQSVSGFETSRQNSSAAHSCADTCFASSSGSRKFLFSFGLFWTHAF